MGDQVTNSVVRRSRLPAAAETRPDAEFPLNGVFFLGAVKLRLKSRVCVNQLLWDGLVSVNVSQVVAESVSGPEDPAADPALVARRYIFSSEV